ncbi:unnamed protein product, partial [Amoebophrya sp. A25]
GTWSSAPRAGLEELWVSYQRINSCFADVVIRTSHHTDLFWIQDYHLLMLPQYLTRKIRKANSDIFKCLPWREEILRAMLCADLVGFQFFEYVRKFFITVKKFLGLDYQFLRYGQMAVEYGGRNRAVTLGTAAGPMHVTVAKNFMNSGDIQDSSTSPRQPQASVLGPDGAEPHPGGPHTYGAGFPHDR